MDAPPVRREWRRLMPSLNISSDVLIVEENGAIYLIPRARPPLRLNRPAAALYRRLTIAPSIQHAINDHSETEKLELSEADEEVRAFLAMLENAGCSIFNSE
jgi:hypothetical protein